VDTARRAFEPLEDMLNKEGIVYHYLVRISHDSTEAVLSTIAEQKINLLIIDYETIRTNKKLQALITCDFLAVLPHNDDNLILEKQDVMNETGLTKDNRKNMVVLYDNGDNSDEVLKITNWFANTGNFNLNVVAIDRKGIADNYEIDKAKSHYSAKDKGYSEYVKRREYFQQAGVELNELHVSEDVEKDDMQFGKLILKSIAAYNPDIVITESTIGKYGLLTKSGFANLLMYRLNCPVIIVKDISFPLVNIAMRFIKQFTGHLSPSYLVKLTRGNTK
jgi:hypothetical protein